MIAIKTERKKGTRISPADRIPATIIMQQETPMSALIPGENPLIDFMTPPGSCFESD